MTELNWSHYQCLWLHKKHYYISLFLEFNREAFGYCDSLKIPIAYCHIVHISLIVADQLISKAVTDNALLLEKLSKDLDREGRVIKCWKHLAYVLNVPAEETRKFDMYTEHSPTEDLFNYLGDIWRPDLTVKELKVKLKAVYRNDVIDSLKKGIISTNIQFIVCC